LHAVQLFQINITLPAFGSKLGQQNEVGHRVK